MKLPKLSKALAKKHFLAAEAAGEQKALTGELTTELEKKWAAQFACPTCGPCEFHTITLGKYCAKCGSPIFRKPATEFDMPVKGVGLCETKITGTGKIKLKELKDRLYLLNTIAGQQTPTLAQIKKVEQQFPVWWDQLKGLFVDAKEKPGFFLRFYDLPKPKVRSLMAEYQKMFPSVMSWEIKSLTQSVNMVVPPDSWEAMVWFETVAARDACKADKAGQEWYTKNASSAKYKEKQFKLQEEKSMAYKNPTVGKGVVILNSISKAIDRIRQHRPTGKFTSGSWNPK